MNKLHIYTYRINYNLLYIYEYKTKKHKYIQNIKQLVIYKNIVQNFFTTVNITSSAGCVSFKNVNM